MQFAFYRIIALLARFICASALVTSSICGVAWRFVQCSSYSFFCGRFEVLIALFLLPSMNNKLSLLLTQYRGLIVIYREPAYYLLADVLECWDTAAYLRIPTFVWVSVQQTSLYYMLHVGLSWLPLISFCFYVLQNADATDDYNSNDELTEPCVGGVSLRSPSTLIC